MSELRLHAIIEVERAQRVRCQAPGCGRSVFRRVHVVELDGQLQVLGEDCCDQLFGWDKARPAPRLAVSEGRRLTAAEREQLVANTAVLLASLGDEIERQREETAIGNRSRARPTAVGTRAGRRFSFARRPERAPPSAEVLAEALRRMQQRHQLDERQSLSPGWSSLLRDVVDEIERDRR